MKKFFGKLILAGIASVLLGAGFNLNIFSAIGLFTAIFSISGGEIFFNPD